MCGRFTLLSLGQFTDLFPWIRMPATAPASRYNIAPSQQIAVVANDGWGLVPFWAKDPSVGNRMINARMESLAERPAYRSALRSQRCLIPADGFYEWKKAGAGGKFKIPMCIRLKSRSPFAFAGLWERWKAGDGSEIRSCTIITGPANELVRPIHDRMPAILRPELVRQWIEPGEQDSQKMLSMLESYPAAEMEAYEVSSKVNSPASEVAGCVEPVQPTAESNPAPGLFD
jgi:putative SOS response-associated peptidase YedK